MEMIENRTFDEIKLGDTASDAALNIYPDLEAKRDIVQNAIDLAHVLGILS